MTPRQIVLAIAAALLTHLFAGTVSAQDADPAAFLPGGARVLQTARGDVDGDGRDDLVSLYALGGPSSGVPRAGLLILLTIDEGVRPIHLFGEPPSQQRGEPGLDPNGSADLTLVDVTGDGRPEILLTVRNQFQEPTPRILLWVFGGGMVPVPAVDSPGPPPPTWAGTGFRLEAFLEGSLVVVMTPGPDNPSPASVLRREVTERRLSGPTPAVESSETYFWRGDGFRLGARSLSLPGGAPASAESPETAVLAFYDAVGKGDLQRATELLGDDLRASRSANPSAASTITPSPMRVEEIRLVGDYLLQNAPSGSERDVYVRVSLDDPREGDPLHRHTFAGTWHTEKIGEQWRLMSANLRESWDLQIVSDALPPGVSIIQTAGGDLRGSGTDDLAVLVSAPGRFSDVEPYVLFARPGGFEPAVPLASYVPEGYIGGPAGTIGIDDVNGDGTPEVTFSAVVGAHAALLWVLRWDGSTLAPLFAEYSNSPTVGLEDLDDDGVQEIVLGQSGYCGGYASSPHISFVFRWEDGTYRPATWRYPSVEDGIDEHASGVSELYNRDGQRNDALACIQHMLALAHALRSKPADARSAYRAYADLRQQLTDDARRFVRPGYVAAPYVEQDLRALLAAAESGQAPGWGPLELAIIHDLLGDALLEQAGYFQHEADSAAEGDQAEAAREARRRASDARRAATRAYQAALALDPNDEEARRAVGP